MRNLEINSIGIYLRPCLERRAPKCRKKGNLVNSAKLGSQTLLKQKYLNKITRTRTSLPFYNRDMCEN